MLQVIYKNGDNKLTLQESDGGTIKEKVISLDLPDVSNDDMIFDSLKGDLWLFKSHMEFYPTNFSTIQSFINYLMK